LKQNKEDPTYHICKATNSPLVFDQKISRTCVMCGFPDVKEEQEA